MDHFKNNDAYDMWIMFIDMGYNTVKTEKV